MIRFEIFRVGSYLSFFAFATYMFFFTFDTAFQDIVYGASAAAACFYVIGIWYKKTDSIASAWLILGSIFVLSFLTVSPIATSLGLTAAVVLLISSYELTRFFTSLEPMISDSENAALLIRLVRNHFRRFITTLSFTTLITLLTIFISNLIPSADISILDVAILASSGLLLSLAILLVRDEFGEDNAITLPEIPN